MFQTLLVHHQGVHQLLLYNKIIYLISLMCRSISPCTGLDRPCTGLDRPCTGLDRPCTGLDRPCTGLDRP